MKQPLYVTLRALAQGAITGSLIAILIGLIAYYGGSDVLIALALFAGPGLLVISYLLERRAKRKERKDA